MKNDGRGFFSLLQCTTSIVGGFKRLLHLKGRKAMHADAKEC